MSNERPYPEGIAWDEAWRQRKRADRMEEALQRIREKTEDFEVFLSPDANQIFVEELFELAYDATEPPQESPEN